MSTLTLHGSALRGPARVVVRQHKRVLIIAGALALTGIIALVAYTLWASQVTDDFEAGPCKATGDPGSSCYQPVRVYLDLMVRFSQRVGYGAAVLTVLPGIISAFVAGPMIARELESGTYKVAWAQSVSPARWLAAKLAVPTVLTVAGVSVLSAVLAWARTHTSTEYPADWFDLTVFASTGTVTVGYTLLGIAVGALTGLLVRRTVAAMSLAALVTGAVLATLASVRSGLWPLRTASGAAGETFRIPAESWIIADGRLTGSGVRLPRDVCWGTTGQEAQCLAEHDVTGRFYDYHPASHFWPLQLVETGILLALTALAVTLAFRVLRRRHG